ncbi:MAG: glycosyltransferase family protein [Cyanophyceae cyanobacterium]
MKLMVYSHDAFGLGNIRRMMAICHYLLDTVPNLSVLLVSGSPVLHSFRMHQGLDYVKIPCLGRNEHGRLATKYLQTEVDDTVTLRAELLKTAAANFRPDALMVDKKPYGLMGELKQTLSSLKTHLPQTKLILLLRDILDAPAATIADWQAHNYYQVLAELYDRILVVGTPEIFDPIVEYQFPDAVAEKVRFCSYIRRELGLKSPHQLRQELRVQPGERLVLVTPGGGGDGYRLVDTYIKGLSGLATQQRIKSFIVFGPEMPRLQREELLEAVHHHPNVQLYEFTDDIASYMEAADVVVSMGGYNTICEILTLNKRAVVVPRIRPVEEQWIRAQRMANLNLFKVIHPERLTPENLKEGVLAQLDSSAPPSFQEHLNALPRIEQEIYRLLLPKVSPQLYRPPFSHRQQAATEFLNYPQAIATPIQS